MNICLFTSVYFNNIGNAFIDLGAEVSLMQAIPTNGNLVKLSQCANFAASMGKAFAYKENPLINWVWVHTMQRFAKQVHDKTYRIIESENVISAASIFDYDYFVIPGCVLTVPFFSIFGTLLKEKRNQGLGLFFWELAEITIRNMK